MQSGVRITTRGEAGGEGANKNTKGCVRKHGGAKAINTIGPNGEFSAVRSRTRVTISRKEGGV